MSLLDKFSDVEDKFNEVERKISDPEIISDQTQYQDLLKKHSELKEGVEIYRKYKSVLKELNDTKELLEDPEMKDMAEEELPALEEEYESLTNELQLYLLPKDPDDNKNAIIEIRSGTGGEEAALFAANLYRMYSRYGEKQGWKTEVVSSNETGLGGIKEISFIITGTNVFQKLKYESGTHRVQRVPETESSGRLHTSAATVAILPEAEDVDVQIDQKDLRIDVYRASGAGGQHVNKTSSAVRITHIPSGVVVACQDERSQFQNKDKAMRLLKSKLYEAKVAEQHKHESSMRKIQVGTGDRSEKIRTYNYPQSRVTDHRINLSVHNLEDVINGSLDEIVEGLIKADQLAKLKGE